MIEILKILENMPHRRITIDPISSIETCEVDKQLLRNKQHTFFN